MESWVLEIQNRLAIGFAIGFSVFNKDEEYDYGEFVLYLGIISLHFKWQ